jgi:uncharacterized metal-binding protein YceD (DUF177 family)
MRYPETSKSHIPPEFSRPVAAESIGSQVQHREITADAEECAALAKRFDLVSLDRLAATLVLQRHAGDTISLTGQLVADVVQSCVVTLAPVVAHVESELEADYGAVVSHAEAIDIDPLNDEALEPLVDGQIDMGEAVAQQLAVALDPYPRARGARLPEAEFAGPGEKTGKKQPFAVLATLKDRPKKPS